MVFNLLPVAATGENVDRFTGNRQRMEDCTQATITVGLIPGSALSSNDMINSE